MSTVSKSFTALGAGDPIFVRAGTTLNYDVSGTFVGTVRLERSIDGGASWTHLPITATGSASGSLVSVIPVQPNDAVYRFSCIAFTSGTIVTSLSNVAKTFVEYKDPNGVSLFKVTEDGVTVGSALTLSSTVTRTAQKRIFKGGWKAGATAGWVIDGATDTHLATCPASKTGSTLLVPISGLKVGDTITAFNLIGQIESAGNGVTVDAALYKQTAAAADVSESSLGAITQVSVTADAIISASKTLATAEVVGADETFYILITATTGASCDIALQGVSVTVTEA